jgi:alanine or glycine:cation symporter, AGCS family
MKKLLLTLMGVILWSKSSLAQETSNGWDQRINDAFEPVSVLITSIVFYGIPIYDDLELPVVVLLLSTAAIFFTIHFKFINFRGFKIALKTVQGRYDKMIPHEALPEGPPQTTEEGDILETIKVEGKKGEITHFQALTAALSATVGLGNIAGVAIAITIGGPGATFWMIVAGFFSMATKFVECTLGVKYRDVGPDGTVYGGPMYYISKGLKKRGMTWLGKVAAVVFAIMCIGGSFGGGNMFQSNQAAIQFNQMIGADLESGNAGTIFGIVLASLVALVIIGGIKRIGKVTAKVVPFMVGIYVLAALTILFLHIPQIPEAFMLIIRGAFSPEGVTGGLIGVLIIGIQRAAFSNEAGIGSAPIAHSAVKTKYPASEGIVALLEPFVDTVIVCTMTALVIIITGAYINVDGLSGVDLTSSAFETIIPWFPYVLTFAVVLFAFSTMLSWSYYGLQSWMYLFGRSKAADVTYKVIFCFFIIIGAGATLDAVIDFSDAMIFAMLVPNMIGLFLLLPDVRAELKKYLNAIKNYEAGKK